MMYKLAAIFLFTMIIHSIGTLAYSVRIVGVKTRRIAVSFAVFNVLVLASRMANSFQGPILAKVVEHDIGFMNISQPVYIFHIIIFAASLGTLTGAFLSPTFQSLLAKLVNKFSIERSIPRLMLHSFSKSGIKQFKNNFRVPSKNNIRHFKNIQSVPVKILIMNTLIISLLTVGSFAALYAAVLDPDLRLTVGALVPIVTGIPTILLVTIIDPFFSLMTDDCLEGKTSEAYFRKCVVLTISSRFAGTVLAQLLLIPAARIILAVAYIL